ncbi:MAG: 4-hydroxy-3-methylbut-2-enyl diphosphate reductase [Planctomycetes bacterium]|nr:4-hydroxy-3-methylbut-2-enyl diphosphate reductase [Planctomycetota bacterium]
MTKKAARNERYVQKGFGLKKQIKGLLQNDYHSGMVDALREADHKVVFGDVTVRLAKDFGFCYGVDRAVDLAYETREHFPDKTLYITNEIIHNPYVNRRLVELGVRFLGGEYALNDVTSDDVVILPAFGVTTEEMAQLLDIECVLVDTTCGSVMNVWRRVRQYVKEGRTSVIHGKYAHEETRATSSRATEEGCHYLVVRDKAEAQLVCDYIRQSPGCPTREGLQAQFATAASSGFDPEQHLGHIGLANQTTMLSTESLEIAEMLGEAVRDRYGEDERFRSFDTICSATQDLQDAALELGRQGDMDLLLVVGGYNSSNTSHLIEIGAEFCPSYHIDSASEILSENELRHQALDEKQTTVTRDWLPAGPITIGITAGASTPNRTVGEVVERLLEVRKIDPRDYLEIARSPAALPMAH